MNSLLIGDFSISALLEKNQLYTPHDLFNNPSIFDHAIQHTIQYQQNVFRIPSDICYRTHLRPYQLEHKIEQILNGMISNSKKQFQQLPSSPLIAGSLGPFHSSLKNADFSQKQKEVAEIIVLLSDFQIDIFLIQNISNIEDFLLIIETIQKIDYLPIAAFFNIFDIQDLNQISKLHEIAENKQLELLGFHIPVHLLNIYLNKIPTSHIPLGFILSNEYAECSKDSVTSLKNWIQNKDCTMIFGGYGFNAKEWNEFTLTVI